MRALRIFLSLLAFASSSVFGEAPNPANVTDVTPDQAEKLLKESPKTLVLDVRTADEFKAGHIPGAKNVDFFDDSFAKQVAALDPATPILVHCAAGGRSAQALPTLKDKKSVYHLKAGFKGWEKAGKPVEK
jgi:rhodanese-related sulfurtransferase